ncbi:MAG: hypothetical protein ACFFD1_12910 [Candidatus Thorarchaeota archaeon]
MLSFDIIKNLCYAIENQVHFVCQHLEEDNYSWRSVHKTPAIGWIIGHILSSHDYIINYSLLGNSPYFSNEFFLSFTTGSTGEFPKEYNSENMFTMFSEVNKLIVNDLKTKNDDWYYKYPIHTEKFAPNWLNKNNIKVLILHFNHGFTHCGQILEIKRLMGKEAWGF